MNPDSHEPLTVEQMRKLDVIYYAHYGKEESQTPQVVERKLSECTSPENVNNERTSGTKKPNDSFLPLKGNDCLLVNFDTHERHKIILKEEKPKLVCVDITEEQDGSEFGYTKESVDEVLKHIVTMVAQGKEWDIESYVEELRR